MNLNRLTPLLPYQCLSSDELALMIRAINHQNVWYVAHPVQQMIQKGFFDELLASRIRELGLDIEVTA